VLVVFKKLMRVIDDLFTIIFFEKLRVDLLLGRLELPPNVVLFADEDELARGSRIVVPQEVMHPEPEIVQVKLGEIVAVDAVWIKVVLLEATTEFPALFVLAPGVTGREENGRRDDGRDDVQEDIGPEAVHREA